MAERYTEEQMIEFREKFCMFDSDGDGCITTIELGSLMRAVGQNVSEADLIHMVNSVDADGSGDIGFPEFLNMMAGKMDGSYNEADVRAEFSLWDQDGSGFVSAAEIRKVTSKLGQNLTDQEIDEQIKAADIDGNGNINYEDMQRHDFHWAHPVFVLSPNNSLNMGRCEEGAVDGVLEEDFHKQRADPINEELDDTMSKTCWLYYCGCTGGGLTTDCSPLCIGKTKMCCVENIMQTVDCWNDEGMCHGIQKICCITTVGSFPPGGGPNDGVPCCALCNYRCGGEDDTGTPGRDEFSQLSKDTFLIYYMCCSGFGFNCTGDHPIIFGNNKFCCVETTCTTNECCTDHDGCYSGRQKCCCCVSAMSCPPGLAGLPYFALCGFKIGGKTKGEDATDSETEDS